MRNCEEIESRYIQYGLFSKQQKSLKPSPLEELVCHLLHGSSKHMRVMFQIDGTQLKGKALHVAGHLGIANFSASSKRIDRRKRRHKIVY
jgi:hypothetical protein